MPMLNTNKKNIFTLSKALTLLSLLFTPAVLAETLFSEHFQVEPIIDAQLANRITTYHTENITLALQQQRAELQSLSSQLKQLESRFDAQPVYWFIKGLHAKNRVSYYTTTGDFAAASQYIKIKNQAYKKAMALSKNTPGKLSSSIYSAIKHGLTKDLKIQAIQSELALGGSGESDSHYWYLHWSNIDQLKKAGRDKEAEAAFKKMKREMRDSGMDMKVYNTLNTQIEKTTLKKTSNQQAQPSPPPLSQSSEKKQEKQPLDNSYIIIGIIVGLALLAIILVTIYELMLKKRNKSLSPD